MSLNSLSLPPSLLVAFYQKALVQNSASPVPFLGKNAKNILLVVNDKAAPFLPDADLEFLTTVLSACGLGLADVALVNWQNRGGADAAAVVAQSGAKKVILFGVDGADFGLQTTALPYAVQAVAGKDVVTAPPLAEIEKDKAAKKQLWLALKQLFSL